MKKRKICAVTGSRAEYGLLYSLLKAIKEDSDMDLQIIVTGMHLSPEFDLTYKEIEKDGFRIDKKVEMLLSADTPSAISKSTALGIIGFADVFAELTPDLVIVLGDRFEILAVSIASMFSRIPIGHINGGEITSGAFDEAIRHSITKMAWWHFTATKKYRKRVIQLGEDEERVFLVGGLSVDGIKKTKLLSKNLLSKKLNFEFGVKNLMVTYHPVTLEKKSSEKYFRALLNVLDGLSDTKIIITAPNADTDGRIIKQMIEKFVLKHKERSISFTTMGRLKYLSSLQFVDAIIGNSSSGLAEAPTFQIGTINIGNRQKGRIKAKSVIDCTPNKKSITKAIEKLYSKDFQADLKNVQNPYGVGNATEKIMNILKTNYLPNVLVKEFFDL